jgi:hypothetical protein
MELITLEVEEVDLLVKAQHSVLVVLEVEVEELYLVHLIHNLVQMDLVVVEAAEVTKQQTLLMELKVEMELLS